MAYAYKYLTRCETDIRRPNKNKKSLQRDIKKKHDMDFICPLYFADLFTHSKPIALFLLPLSVKLGIMFAAHAHRQLRNFRSLL